MAPTLRYLERAYDAAKYGEMSAAAVSRGHDGGQRRLDPFPVRALCVAPGRLGDSARATVEQSRRRHARSAFPALETRSARSRSITPLDLEQTWGLTEGDLNHGQLILDQMFFMRPMPGWSNHRTPIDGLYLCGSGVHGGGGISGAGGRNAARQVLKA